jgi:hypothetical protein
MWNTSKVKVDYSAWTITHLHPRPAFSPKTSVEVTTVDMFDLFAVEVDR